MPRNIFNRQKKGNPPKRGFPWYIWTAIGVITVAIVVVLVIFIPSWTTNPPPPGSQTDGLKCAIVDQLYIVEPNQVFIDYTTRTLEDFGFQVDIFQGEEITVDFYKKLPSYGYKLIIFRVHGGLLQNETGVGNTIWMFTSEPYSRLRYFIAQMRDQVRAAGTSYDTRPLFAISPRFVTDCMQGDFNDTVIINMGCAAFYNDELAKMYVNKGASAYLAWDVSVGLHYVDDTTMTLIEKLCSEELTISSAVKTTMNEEGPDPNNNAFLYYYPPTNGDKTLRELID